MQHVFWLRANQIAGRVGPDTQPWNPVQFADAGITHVISVNDGRLVHAEDFSAIGIEYRNIPFSPNAPPRPGDMEHCLQAVPAALSFVVDAIDSGGQVLIHCTSGKDRTGLLMCAYLCLQEGYSVPAAIEEVKRVRPIALTATDYEPFVQALLTRLQEADNNPITGEN